MSYILTASSIRLAYCSLIRFLTKQKGNSMLSTSHQYAFTIIELLIVLSLITILITQAIPSFNHLLQGITQQKQLQQLINAHHIARNTAIKENQRVVFCESTDNIHCTHNTFWQQGGIIFIDNNKNSQHDDNELIVHHTNAFDTQYRLSYKGFAAPYVIQYFPTGLHNTNGHFTLCSKQSKHQLIIARTGKYRVKSFFPTSNAPLCWKK